MGANDIIRASPDELLRQLQEQEDSARGGRLKVFLGYAPRAGKSLRMFEEGCRRIQRGQDVVVGAIQVKGSHDLTDLIGRFEVIPPLVVGGMETVDVEAILRRKPGVGLIDEL